MTVPTVPTVRVVWRFVQHGEERVNVFHYEKSSDWSPADLTTIATAVSNAWRNTARVNTTSGLCLVDTVATSLLDEESAQATIPCLTQCCGDSSAEPEPGNVTATISWRTTGIGRSKRGRTYFPGFTIPWTNNDDTINSTYLITLNMAAQAIYNAAASVSTSALAVFSRVLNTPSVVTAWVLENVLDSQRRRLPRRGR